MKYRIAIAVSALTLGTALAAVPSFAQTRNQPNGTAAQSESCVHFQQGCSDKPYPMGGQNASPNSAQNSGQAGTRGSRQARSIANRARPNRQRQSSERLSSEQPNRSPQAFADRRVNGETYGFAGQNGYYNEPYYNSAPGVAAGPVVAAGPASPSTDEWCAMRFRSFNPATGTYMGFDGMPHPCP